MKTLILLAVLLTNAAHASYFATFCSSADGSVRWESGHNSNSIKFEFDGPEGVESKSFSMSDVILSSAGQTVISSIDASTCQLTSFKKIYVDLVKITPREESSEVSNFLNLQFNGVIKTEVLCKYEMSARGGNGPCPVPEEDFPTKNP